MFINEKSIMVVYSDRTGNPQNMGLYIKSNGNYILTTDTEFQNGRTYYLSLGKYILEAKYGYHKLWGEDTGRTLSGEYSGTLLGIFPKITVQFRSLSKNEVEIIAPILDSAKQTIYYYDPSKKMEQGLNTYTGDYEITNKKIINISNGQDNEGFSCAFISRSKRW